MLMKEKSQYRPSNRVRSSEELQKPFEQRKYKSVDTAKDREILPFGVYFTQEKAERRMAMVMEFINSKR